MTQDTPHITADATTLPYRKGVGMMVVNAQNQVLVGKRIDSTTQAWQMPQGGMDAGESPTVAAMRELKEEVDIDTVSIIAQSADWHYYDLPPELIGKLWGGQYRGQQQKWFLMRLKGDESDVNVHTDEPEFSAVQWVDMHRLPDLIVPFKRALYQSLVEEFSAALRHYSRSK